MSSHALLCLFTWVVLFVRDSEGLRVPESSRGWHIIWKRENISTPAGLWASGVIKIKVRVGFTVEDRCNRNISAAFSCLIVFYFGFRRTCSETVSLLYSPQCFDNQGILLLCTSVVWYVFFSVDSQLSKLSRDDEAKLLMCGWIWRVFIVIAKTWRSASQINTSFSLPLLFSPPRLCPLLDVRAAREQMHMGGVTYPTLPLQDAAPRPHSGYSQHSAACSPSGSFAGSLPPQPHSAYFSGMTGPQHPFYNRVRQERDLCSDNRSSAYYLEFTRCPY